MTQQEKQLLLRDLSARVPYGVIVHRYSDNCYSDNCDISIDNVDDFAHFLEYSEGEEFKPYLRPMSSMTEEEKAELLNLRKEMNMHQHLWFDRVLDFYLSHHLDWRGLILLGLALEAPEGMYKTE